MHARLSTLLAAAFLAAASGALAATTTVEAILDAPTSFAGQTVTVVGTVADPSLGFAGETLYQIRDDGRPITVVGRGPALAPGQTIEVTGTVRVRPPDEEFTFPPVIQETSHRAP
ncbi:MAG TPA: hypothetical protein VFD84_02395 [Candidatus Binatia bacterium]|jgi:hypothetical protein|nr:hypothetical protein [Candidatus Binatia bacterium]